VVLQWRSEEGKRGCSTPSSPPRKEGKRVEHPGWKSGGAAKMGVIGDNGKMVMTGK